MIEIGPNLSDAIQTLVWVVGVVGFVWACAWGSKE